MLKYWARDVLDLTNNPRNGLKKNLIFTCTFIDEPAEASPSQTVLQILNARVEDHDGSPVGSVDIAGELERRAWYFDDPKSTNDIMQEVVQVYNTSPFGSREKNMARDVMSVVNIPIIMTFKSAVEGATAPVCTVEKIPWAVMVSSSSPNDPALWLL